MESLFRSPGVAAIANRFRRAAVTAPPARLATRLRPDAASVANARTAAAAPRATVAILLACCGLLYSYRLGAKDFWEPAEGRTAIVAREMLASGNWLIPRIAGESYVQKPPLFHWLVAFSFWLTGVQSEGTARIPSVLAALATVWMVYRLGWRLGGPRVGRTAALATGLSVIFTWHARQAELDMLLTLWVVIAYWAFHRAQQGRWWDWAAFHAAVGLAVMTKGLVGLLLIWLPLLAYGAWQRLGSRSAARPRTAVGMRGFWMTSPLSAIIAVPWYAFLVRQLPQMVPELYAAGTFQEIGHPHGFSYYLVRLPLAFLPFTVLLPWTLALPWRSGGAGPKEHADTERAAARLLFCWFALPFVAFQLWPSKQTHYLLPLIPALALATALALETVSAARGFWSLNLREEFARLAAWAIPATCAVAAPVVAMAGYGDSGWLLVAAAAVLALVSLALRVSPRWRRRLGLEAAMLQVFAVLWVVYGHVVPELNVQESHKPFLASVQQMVPAAEPLVGFHMRAHDLFYLQRPLVLLEHRSEWQTTPGGKGYAIVRQNRLWHWRSDSYTTVLSSQEVSRNDDLALVRLGAEE